MDLLRPLSLAAIATYMHANNKCVVGMCLDPAFKKFSASTTSTIMVLILNIQLCRCKFCPSIVYRLKDWLRYIYELLTLLFVDSIFVRYFWILLIETGKQFMHFLTVVACAFGLCFNMERQPVFESMLDLMINTNMHIFAGMVVIFFLGAPYYYKVKEKIMSSFNDPNSSPESGVRRCPQK